MPLSKVAVASASLVAALLAAPRAFAGNMDTAPERLTLQPPNLPAGYTCQSIASDPNTFSMKTGMMPNNFPCQPNNQAWASMMSELGMAIAPSALHSARTTGLGGFNLSFEAVYTHINADASVTNKDGSTTQYWHDGTQGPVDPNNHQFSVVNKSPDSLLQVYSLKARKGLAYGFEVAGVLGYLANTSLWTGGADIRWSILEGFRTGLLGYLPDISAGGGVRTLGGSSKFFLTTVGVDGQISKPFTLADSSVITPYVGAQWVYIYADSTVVDLTPNVDPLQQCGYLGNNTPSNPYGKAPYDGQPVCQNHLSNGAPNNSDFNNNVTFQKLRESRWRGIAGLNYRYELLWLAGQFMLDLTDPQADGSSLTGMGGKQWAVALEAGVFF